MRIEVSKYFIDIGCKRDGSNCPIALAIAYKIGYKNVERISVGEDNVAIKLGDEGKKKKKFQYIDLSQRARKFIRNFDSNLSVKPFSFNFPINLEK